MAVENTCSVCGNPEGRNYKPPEGVDFVCSTCVKHSLGVGQLVRSDPIDFKRGFIRALFLENGPWIDCITKHGMIVPGNPKNPRRIKQDLTLKEKLADQIHPDTYQERKAYYLAWINAKCCADDCDQNCDECHGIRFEPVPSSISNPLDPDVRRFIEKYQRFWLTSEQDKAIKDIRRGVDHGDGREVSDQTDSDDIIRDGERKRTGQSGERKEDSSNPYQRQKESFLWPGPGEMAIEKSLKYWGQ